ncbi:MAG: hypothetical protein JW940_01005 [Polyangiaceae bacterium]|nr:hypothetical protein [Polyangiaceae bacterium]
MTLDLVDALALLLGLFYGVRWASVRRANSVRAADCARASWQRVERAEMRALTLMTSACVAKVVLELGIQGLMPRLAEASLAQWPTSMGIDLCWMALMFVGLWKRASARQQRAKLGMPPQ